MEASSIRGEGYSEPLTSFTVGNRVELHPATDRWMMGDRFGEVIKIGTRYLHIKMDVSGKVLKFSRHNIRKVAERSMPVRGME